MAPPSGRPSSSYTIADRRNARPSTSFDPALVIDDDDDVPPEAKPDWEPQSEAEEDEEFSFMAAEESFHGRTASKPMKDGRLGLPKAFTQPKRTLELGPKRKPKLKSVVK